MSIKIISTLLFNNFIILSIHCLNTNLKYLSSFMDIYNDKNKFKQKTQFRLLSTKEKKENKTQIFKGGGSIGRGGTKARPTTSKNNRPIAIRIRFYFSDPIIFYYFLIAILIVILLYFIYLYYKKRKNLKEFNEKCQKIIENKHNSLMKDNNYIDYSITIHNHLNFLSNLIEHIRKINSSLFESNICLICTQPILYSENIYRFECQHFYHDECIIKYNISKCLMCEKIPNIRIINNNSKFQLLTENNIKSFISNLNIIYPPKYLFEYSKNYFNEFKNFNEIIMLGTLMRSWNIRLISIYNFNNENRNFSDINNNINDGLIESNISGFQPRDNCENIEMIEVNNDNGNDGFDFDSGNF